MSDHDGSDVDTGLCMRDLLANAKALLQSGVASETSVNVKGLVQISLTADVTNETSEQRSSITKEVEKHVFLAINGSTSTRQSIPQDELLPSGTSDSTPKQDSQRKMLNLLLEQNNLLKRLYKVFETNGATLVDVQSGSIVFLLQIACRNSLKTFWNAYKDGLLQSQIQDILITKELEQKAGCRLVLRLHIDEKDYFQALEYFGNQELRLVLVGRTGTGKSSAGNHILLKYKKGQRPFATAVGASSVTEECNFSSNEVLGRRVVVVDTPGLFDTSRENSDVLTQLTRFLLYTQPGPHAIILVMRAGIVTEEVQETVNLLVKLFKEDVFSYMIVLFTAKDKIEENDVTLKEYLETLPSSIKDIINKCGDRCIAFNNMASKEDNIAQVDDLLKMIDHMVQANGGDFYESELHAEIRGLVASPELTSNPEAFRETAKYEGPETGSWFLAAVSVVSALLGWDMGRIYDI